MPNFETGNFYAALNELAVWEKDHGQDFRVFGLRLSHFLRSLLNLKVEWEYFVDDSVTLERVQDKSSGTKIIYAIDDQLVRAYVEMQDNDKRSFAYPLTKNWKDPENIQKRGWEYLGRLEMLLQTERKDGGLLLLPPCVEDLSLQITHKESEFENSVLNPRNNQQTERLERLDEVINDLTKKLSTIYYNEKKLNELSKEITGIALNVETQVEDRIYKLINIGNWVSKERLKRFLKSDGIIGPGEDVEISLKTLSGSDISVNIGDLIRRPLSEEAEAHVETLYLRFRNVNETIRKAKDQEKSTETLWGYAQRMGYLFDVNNYLRKKEIDATVQFLTTRQLLRWVVRDHRARSSDLMPLRHPKFLARNLDPEIRIDTVGTSNKLINQLELGLFEINGLLASSNNNPTPKDFKKVCREAESLANKTFNTISTLKSFVYSNELVEKTELREGQITLQAITNENLSLAEETGVKEWLATGLEDTTILLSFVDEIRFADGRDERQHMMILPNSNGLRYVVKIPVSFTSESARERVREADGQTEEIPILILFSKKLSKANSEFTKFEEAIFAAARGNWALSFAILNEFLRREAKTEFINKDIFEDMCSDILKSGTYSDIDRREFIREMIYLRHLGARAVASAASTEKRANKYMEVAAADIRTLREIYPEEVRFELIELGMHLDRSVLKLDDFESDDSAQPIDYKFRPSQNILRCLEIEDDRQKEIEAQSRSRKRNNDQDVCTGQALYWRLMRARALECAAMNLMAIETEVVSRSMSNYTEVRLSQKFNRNDFFDRYVNAWRDVAASFETITSPTITTRPKPSVRHIDNALSVPKGDTKLIAFIKAYPVAHFIYHYERLRHINGKFPELDNYSKQKFKAAKAIASDVFDACSQIEAICNTRTKNSFSKRILIPAQEKIYVESRSKLDDLLESAFSQENI